MTKKELVLFSGTRGTAKKFLSESKGYVNKTLKARGFKITRTGKLPSGAWGIFGRRK